MYPWVTSVVVQGAPLGMAQLWLPRQQGASTSREQHCTEKGGAVVVKLLLKQLTSQTGRWEMMGGQFDMLLFEVSFAGTPALGGHHDKPVSTHTNNA